MLVAQSTFFLGVLVLCSDGVVQCPYEHERYEPGNGLVLAIENYNFGRIDQDTFDGVRRALPGLETFILRNTSIRMIAPDSFAELSTLRCLDLTDNEITYLRDRGDMLRGVANITTLVLARNHLRIVSDSAFIYVRQLVQLDLSENNLDVLSLSNAALRGLDMLEELYLDYNDMTHLSPLLLSHTPSLRKLSVSNNPLVKIGIYSLPQLQVFTAHKTLLPDFPRFPQSTRIADLRDGQMVQIERARSSDLWHFASLLLSGNRWDCSCDSLWFLQWSNYSRNTVADYSNLTCSEPKMYRGVTFSVAANELICSNEQNNSSVIFNTQIKSLQGPVFHANVGDRMQITTGTDEETPTTQSVFALGRSTFLLPPPNPPLIDGSKSSINRAAIERYLQAKKILNSPTVKSEVVETESSSSGYGNISVAYGSSSYPTSSPAVLFSSLIGAFSWPTLTLSLIFGVVFATVFVILALIVRGGVQSIRRRRLLGRYMRQSPAATINQPSVTVSPARSDIILCDTVVEEPRRYNALDQYVPRMSLPDRDQLTACKARSQPPAPLAQGGDSVGSNARLVPPVEREELHTDEWMSPADDALSGAGPAASILLE